MRNFLSISLFVLSTLPGTSFAQDISIQFQKIPKGLKAQYRLPSGRFWVEIYKGKEGKFYIVETRHGNGDYVKTGYYSTDGHLAKEKYANGNVRTYLPRHCERVLGDCTHAYSNSDGASGTAKASVKPSGKGYKFTMSLDGNRKTSISYTLGQYNLYAQARANGKLIKLVSLTQ